MLRKSGRIFSGEPGVLTWADENVVDSLFKLPGKIQRWVARVRLFYERFEYSEEFRTSCPEGSSDNLFRIV